MNPTVSVGGSKATAATRQCLVLFDHYAQSPRYRCSEAFQESRVVVLFYVVDVTDKPVEASADEIMKRVGHTR